MADEAKPTDTSAPEIKPEEKKPEEKKPEPAASPTARDVFKTSDEQKPSDKETIGLDKFLEIKKENKELRKSMKNLEDKINSGDFSQDEISSDLEAIAEEHNVDQGFLKKVVKTITKEADKRADEKYGSKLKDLTDKDTAKKIDDAFGTAFDTAMANMPEYKDVVNRDVIKALSLEPKNANKTFSQIIEDAYGNAISGKRTVETTTPGAGKDADPLDFDRARKDSAYFKDVMASPRLKKEYNDAMLKRF